MPSVQKIMTKPRFRAWLESFSNADSKAGWRDTFHRSPLVRDEGADISAVRLESLPLWAQRYWAWQVDAYRHGAGRRVSARVALRDLDGF